MLKLREISARNHGEELVIYKKKNKKLCLGLFKGFLFVLVYNLCWTYQGMEVLLNNEDYAENKKNRQKCY